MPKGNGTKNCFPLLYAGGVLRVGERTLMAADVVEDNAGQAAARLRAGGKVFLEAVGTNLEDVKKLIGEN